MSSGANAEPVTLRAKKAGQAHLDEVATVIEALTRAAGNVIEPGQEQGELREIALQAMATDPQRRYPSVKAFQQALRDYEAHAESIRLAEEATGELAQAEQTRSYDVFGSIRILQRVLREEVERS